jgi:hypothetical protein
MRAVRDGLHAVRRRAMTGVRPRFGGVSLCVVAALLLVLAVPLAVGQHASVSYEDVNAPRWVELPRPGGPVPVRPGTATGAVNFVVVDTDPASVPNHGVETNITDFAQGFLNRSSYFQADGSVIVGNCDAVYGIFENWTTAPVAFFALFPNGSSTATRTELWTGLVLQPGEGYGFSFTAGSGDLWELEVDGVPFGDSLSDATADCSSNEDTWLPAIGFDEVGQFVNGGFVPPNVTAGVAFATLIAGSWYLPRGGNFTSSSAFTPPWGLEGREQLPTLAPGELYSGASIPLLPEQTALWIGGPVPVDVAVSIRNATVTAEGSDPVGVELDSTAGFPLDDVPVGLIDRDDGSFTPALVTTDGDGEASADFVGPNGSARTLDTLSAFPLLLGYVGNASTSVTVLPSVQIFLSAAPSESVQTLGTLPLAVRATNASGAPAVGVPISFVTGHTVGTIEDGLTPTDAGGNATTTFYATSVPGSAIVTARVVYPGFWGVVTIAVSVHSPPVPWTSRIAPYVPDLAVAGAVALVVAGLLWWNRRRRRPIPFMVTLKPSSFRRAARAPSSGGSPPPPAQPLSRRLRGGGIP